jgi:ABC-2 type transport system permease protein
MGLKQLDSENTDVTYTALASTSDSSVLKTDVSNAQTYEKEKGDEDGPFDTVVAATKTITISDASDEEETTSDSDSDDSDDSDDEDSESSATTVTSNMLVFGSVYSLSDTMDEFVQGSNTQIVNNALNEYIDTEVTTVSVPAKSLTSSTLTVTESGARLFGMLLAVVAPIIVLAGGILVWVRRRKY